MSIRKHTKRLERANGFVSTQVAIDPPKDTPYYPRHHVSAACGWINDPNGLVQHKGVYHAFYQLHPYSCEWGPMHWGHSTSHDLIHWDHHPIALAPSEDYDQDGCFSGSALSHEGKLYLLYTGHSWLGEPGDDSKLKQVQCLASSDDGIHFTKHGVVIEAPFGMNHFRDPKMWRAKNSFFCVVGCKDETSGEPVPKVLLYRSFDLLNWKLVNVLAEGKEGDGYMFECPDFFELDSFDVLMMSPQGLKATEYTNQNLHNAGVILGDWDTDYTFHQNQGFKELDLGPDFYAPQTFLSDDGRRIMLGWANMWESPLATQKWGFNGSLTFPRELRIIDGKLMQFPVKELEILRGAHVTTPPLKITHEVLRLNQDLPGFEFEILFDPRNSTANAFGFTLGSQLAFTFTFSENRAMLKGELRRSYSQYGLKDTRNFLADGDRELRIHGFFDRGLLEVFLNDGEQVFTTRAMPPIGDRSINCFANEGSVRMEHSTIWEFATGADGHGHG